MEFPELGQNCSVSSCKQLDFLPVRCDACRRIFCKDHFAYAQHQCPESYKKDNQVPVCPLCNEPISVRKGDLPDIVVGRHIDNDCQSDTAQQKRKVYSNRCALKGCKQKELIPFKCDSCHKNYCIRHRLSTDHDCNGYEGSGKGMSNAGAAAIARNQSQAPKSIFKSPTPQKTSLSSVGRDLDRERRERQQQAPPQPRNLRAMQTGMTEDEAMAMAIAASLSDSTPQDSKSLAQRQQEEADAALARALQESEQQARNRPRQQQSASRSSNDKSCSVS